MMRNGGVYISADFSDFGKRGTAEMKALLLDQASRSPSAPVFLACGSWGGKICWRLIADGETGPLVKGVLFLDSEMNTDFVATAAKLRRIGGRRSASRTRWRTGSSATSRRSPSSSA